MKIKTGDTVLVCTGKDKGTKGTVVKAFPQLDKILVEGVNIVKKHVKPRGHGSKGERMERSLPIHVSNVALVEGKKAGRVTYAMKDGKKTRVIKGNRSVK